MLDKFIWNFSTINNVIGIIFLNEGLINQGTNNILNIKNHIILYEPVK